LTISEIYFYSMDGFGDKYYYCAWWDEYHNEETSHDLIYFFEGRVYLLLN